MSTLVLASGGLDSTTLIAYYLARGEPVQALGFDYGQRHVRELKAARAVAAFYGLDYQVADLRDLARLLTGSALTDPAVPVPHGPYDAASMRATVVPNRNMIMMSVAVGAAVARGCDRVAVAVHSGDHDLYPDCRPNYVRAFALAAALATEGIAPPDFTVSAPFAHWPKRAIVECGAELGAPLHLTWSCYEGGMRHCGRCGTCAERRTAFALAKVPDPTDYADATEPT